jgi:hypothetical protein
MGVQLTAQPIKIESRVEPPHDHPSSINPPANHGEDRITISNLKQQGVFQQPQPKPEIIKPTAAP